MLIIKSANKNDYSGLFIHFIGLEVPNIIQIISLLGFLSFMFKILYLKWLLPLLVMFLLSLYLVSKSIEYLTNQFSDKFSRFNLKKMNEKILLNYWVKHSILLAILLGFTIFLLSEILI